MNNNKILIIEDEMSINDALSFFLENSGYNCTSVYNGVDALELLYRGTYFDLVLCDINLPDILGYEIFNVVKKSRGYDKTIFIFLTAYADDKFKEIGLSLGANAYITKPFSNKHLIYVISERFRSS